MQLFIINKAIHYTRDTFNSFMGQGIKDHTAVTRA